MLHRCRIGIGACVAFLTLVGVASARAQNVERLGPRALMDQPLALSPGRVVHIRDLVVFRGHSGPSLTIYTETPTPAKDSAQLAQEAKQIVAHYAEYSAAQRIESVTVTFCRTPACVELRERSDERFDFERGTDGTWRPTKP